VGERRRNPIDIMGIVYALSTRKLLKQVLFELAKLS
jgi:hypothetical protein